MSTKGEFLTQSVDEQPFPWLFEAGSAITNCPADSWKRTNILSNVAASFVTFNQSERILEETNAERIFYHNDFSGRTYGDLATNILKKWEGRQEPSLACILYKAADRFDLSAGQRTAVLVAAMLGSEESGHAYHNASHNRKVVLQSIRLAAEVNLSASDAARLLISAATHDLGHDGKGNRENGAHAPFHLEKMAFDYARPYLKAAGLSDGDLDDIKTIILATDVTPIGHKNAPARILAEGRLNELPAELSLLQNKPGLLKLARMISVADVAPSAALSAEMGWRENILVSHEAGFDASVENYDNFSKAVQASFDALPEAKAVYGNNPETIRKEMPAYVRSLSKL